jgi:hypothetical protein
MPYKMSWAVSATIPSASLPLPFDTKEEFQDRLVEISKERDTWKRRYQEMELERDTLEGKLTLLESKVIL